MTGSARNSTEIHPDIRDQRAARLCTDGAVEHLARLGLSYRTFCRGGYPLSVLRDTGDALLERVCRAAEVRADRESSDGR